MERHTLTYATALLVAFFSFTAVVQAAQIPAKVRPIYDAFDNSQKYSGLFQAKFSNKRQFSDKRLIEIRDGAMAAHKQAVAVKKRFSTMSLLS